VGSCRFRRKGSLESLPITRTLGICAPPLFQASIASFCSTSCPPWALRVSARSFWASALPLARLMSDWASCSASWATYTALCARCSAICLSSTALANSGENVRSTTLVSRTMMPYFSRRLPRASSKSCLRSFLLVIASSTVLLAAAILKASCV